MCKWIVQAVHGNNERKKCCKTKLVDDYSFVYAAALGSFAPSAIAYA